MHPIQDAMLTIGGLTMAFALVPTVLGKQKPALSTCLMTGSTLAVFAAVYLSLDLLFSAGTTFFSSAIWLVLGVQKYHQT